MTELSNWNHVRVPQRNPTGSILVGYEWLIRYLNVQDIDMDTFQEDFDLGERNSFQTVSQSIMSRYPHVRIGIQEFDQSHAIEKIERIRDLLERGVPCLLSFAIAERQEGQNPLSPQGWHIMPVISVDDSEVRMIHHVQENRNVIWVVTVREIIWRHQHLDGGKDISWINAL